MHLETMPRALAKHKRAQKSCRKDFLGGLWGSEGVIDPSVSQPTVFVSIYLEEGTQ